MSEHSQATSGWMNPEPWWNDSEVTEQDLLEIMHSLNLEEVPKAVEIPSGDVLEFGAMIAAGGYADIYEATMIRPKNTLRQHVAVKILRFSGIRSPDQQGPHDIYVENITRIDKRLCREMTIWKRLTHPHITPFLGYALASDRILPHNRPMLISPYRKNGNLCNYLSRNPEADKLLLLQQTCEGLNYLHTFEGPIAHLDLKPSNILVNDNGEAELCDFGLARALEEACTGFTTSTAGAGGTLGYMAPEVLDEEIQTTASDIYSMGSVILEVLSGVQPWGETRRHGGKVILEVVRGKTPPPEKHMIVGFESSVVDAIWTLMKRCWSYDPSDRPNSSEVLNTLRDLQVRVAAGGMTHNHHLDSGNGLAPELPEIVTLPLLSSESSGRALHGRNAVHGDLSTRMEPYWKRLKRRLGSLSLRAFVHHYTGYSLHERYRRNHNPLDLNTAIESFRKAVALRPPGHPLRAVSISELAVSLKSRYDRDNNPEDLDDVIDYYREAVALQPPGHSYRADWIYALADLLKSRHDRDYNDEDLEAAIEYFREAVAIRPPGHPHRDVSIYALAESLESRRSLKPPSSISRVPSPFVLPVIPSRSFDSL